jgi:hypothetical protein
MPPPPTTSTWSAPATSAAQSAMSRSPWTLRRPLQEKHDAKASPHRSIEKNMNFHMEHQGKQREATQFLQEGDNVHDVATASLDRARVSPQQNSAWKAT